MDRSSFILIGITVVFYLGWQYYLDVKYPERFKAQKQAVVASTPLADSTQEATLAADEPAPKEKLETNIPVLDAKSLILENDEISCQFNQHTGSFDAVILKKYQNDEQTGPMNIAPEGLLLQGTTSIRGALQKTLYRAERQESQRLSFVRQEGSWEVAQSYELDTSGYGLTIRFSYLNQSDKPLELHSAILLASQIDYPKKSSSFLPGMPSAKPNAFLSKQGDTIRSDIQDFCEGSESVQSYPRSEVSFFGFDNHYFMKVLIPELHLADISLEKLSEHKGLSCQILQRSVVDSGLVAPGQKTVINYKAWLGPKDTGLIESYYKDLSSTLDFGFFAKISHGLLSALKLVFAAVGNWGLAIIIFTMFLKILFYPLVRQGAIAQAKLKKLQPEMNRIKEKYKDDVQKQQQEIMRFMSEQKVNPLKGCLPILPQIPVFFAFYRVLSTSIELRQAPFYAWIRDLSVADPYFITPILLGAGMFMQQKMMPTTGMDKAQERIMMMMPLFFSLMMLTLPAGMVLYMLANTFISIGQQKWLNKKLANA